MLVLVGSCCLRIRLQTPVVLLWGELPDRPRSPRRTSPRRPVLTTSGPTSACPERGEELPEVPQPVHAPAVGNTPFSDLSSRKKDVAPRDTEYAQ